MLKWIILSIGIKILFVFSIGINASFTFIDLYWSILSIGIHKKIILICLISPLYWFYVSNKKGEKNVLFLLCPFVDDWQKGGELFVSLCMFYMHVLFYLFVCRLIVLLVSRALFKSMFLYLVPCFMHDYAYIYLWAFIAYFVLCELGLVILSSCNACM